MASTLGRNLHLCFSMIKRPLGPQPIGDHDRPNPTATTSSTSTALVKNFNSLYDHSTATFDDSATTASNPDFAAAFASQRFFFSTPGRSNSIVEESGAERSEGGGRLRDSVAVPTYSPDPYADFRRSMQEMVEARDVDLKSDWEYLHELLLCYLALNPKSTHKFIIGAFSDLLVSLLPAADKTTRYNV